MRGAPLPSTDMTRRLWVSLGIVAAIMLGGAAYAAGTELRQADPPAVAAATSPPAPATTPAGAEMTRLEVCGALLTLNVTSSKALLDHAKDRVAGRRATGDPTNLEATANALKRLEERGPSDMALPIIAIEKAMLQIAMEALGGPMATYTQAETTEAYAKIKSQCWE